MFLTSPKHESTSPTDFDAREPSLKDLQENVKLITTTIKTQLERCICEDELNEYLPIMDQFQDVLNVYKGCKKPFDDIRKRIEEDIKRKKREESELKFEEEVKQRRINEEMKKKEAQEKRKKCEEYIFKNVFESTYSLLSAKIIEENQNFEKLEFYKYLEEKTKEYYTIIFNDSFSSQLTEIGNKLEELKNKFEPYKKIMNQATAPCGYDNMFYEYDFHQLSEPCQKEVKKLYGDIQKMVDEIFKSCKKGDFEYGLNLKDTMFENKLTESFQKDTKAIKDNFDGLNKDKLIEIYESGCEWFLFATKRKYRSIYDAMQDPLSELLEIYYDAKKFLGDTTEVYYSPYDYLFMFNLANDRITELKSKFEDLEKDLKNLQERFKSAIKSYIYDDQIMMQKTVELLERNKV